MHNPDRAYVEILIDQLHLLVPRDEVVMLESSSDLSLGRVTSGGSDRAPLTYFDNGAYQWPVYALDDGLHECYERIERRRVFVLFEAPNWRFGLLADAFNTLADGDLRMSPLPLSMQTADNAVSGLVVAGDLVLCLSTAARIGARLGPQARRGGDTPMQSVRTS